MSNNTKEQNKQVELDLFKCFLKTPKEEIEKSKEEINSLLSKIASIEELKKYNNIIHLALMFNVYYSFKSIDLGELIELYNQLLNNISELAKELHFNNSLEIGNMFTYLLWGGYFSINHNNKYKIDKRLNIPHHYALDLTLGRGVCLNYSDMLTDLLNKCRINSTIMINKTNFKKIDLSYRPSIDRGKNHTGITMSFINYLVTPITNIYGNHACVLTEYNGTMYIYDPTNLVVYTIDGDIAKIIFGNGNIEFKTLVSYVFAKQDYQEEMLDKLYLSDLFTKPFTAQEYIDVWENNLNVLNSNAGLIADFYSESKDTLTTIADLAIKKNGYVKEIIRSRKK